MMNPNLAGKYKDCSPVSTINRIKKILQDRLECPTIESYWFNPLKDFYSTRISIPGTMFGTNGKGTDAEYCLASGYAEFIERLQNQHLYFRYFSGQVDSHAGFIYAPDETRNTLTQVEMDCPRLVDSIKSLGKLGEEREQAPVCLPFFHVRKGSIINVPVNLISNRFEGPYASNGMCAGNTPEEALVHGISEIMENHAVGQLFKRRCTPPTVPDSVIDQFPRLRKMIDRLVRDKYMISVKDLSLGERLPVLGVLLTNRDNQKYCFSAGAHPSFEIALERCLTELMQGKQLDKFDEYLTPFSFEEELSTRDNIHRIAVSRQGSYPRELFKSKATYPFADFGMTEITNNREMLSYLVGVLDELDVDLLVRNVSFLDFPSFQILAPGFSEVFDPVDIDPEEEEFFDTISQIRRILENPDGVSESDIESVRDVLEDSEGAVPLESMLLLTDRSISPIPSQPTGIFTAMLDYRRGRYDSAYNNLLQVLQGIERFSYDPLVVLFFKCLRDFFGARKQSFSLEETKNLLSQFYKPEVIGEVLYYLKDTSRYFKDFACFPCWECEGCSNHGGCKSEKIRDLHLRLKVQYLSNCPDQNALGKLFEC